MPFTKEERARIKERATPEEAKELFAWKKRDDKKSRAMALNPIGWYNPLPAQLEFHKATARKRLCTGGNRSGKTEAGVAELIWWLLGKHPYRDVPENVTGIVVSESFDVQRDTIIEKMGALMPQDGSIKLTWNRDTKHAIGPNGRCIFKSQEQGWRAFQGIALDFFWPDEEGEYEVVKQLSKRLKKGSIIQSWYTLTPEPDKSDHWTFDALAAPARDRKEGVVHFTFDLEDNRVSRGGFIADSEIDHLIASTPIDDRPAVIHGKYVRRGGLMFPMWKRSDHVERERPIKEFLEGVRKGIYTPFCSLDWGVRNPTSIGLFVEDSDENIHRVDEIFRPAQSVRDIKKEYKTRFGIFQPIFVVADPSIWYNHDSQDHSRTIAGQLEMDEKGLPGLPLIKADNDVTNGLAAVRELLRVDPLKGAKYHVQPRCTNHIREIESYVGEEWQSAPHLRNKKETPQKRNDHSMDDVRYFAMSPHRFIKPRHMRRTPEVHVNPVTGYLRAVG